VSLWHPSRACPDFNLAPSGFTRFYTAGASISANQIVSLHTDGKVYPASPTYPNVVGVALRAAATGELVEVLVLGIAQVVSDGAISPGQPVTFSPTTPGRAVRYAGHYHDTSRWTDTFLKSVSPVTDTFLKDVTPTTDSFLKDVTPTTDSFLKDVTPSTGTFVTGISKSTGSAVTSVGSDTGWYSSAGYARHGHSTTTGTFLTDVTPLTGTALTGITKSPGSAVVDLVKSPGTVVTGLSKTPGTAVTSLSPITGTALTDLVVLPMLSRVIGIALTGATAAGQLVTILVIPLWL
jgi:hypothetical protein